MFSRDSIFPLKNSPGWLAHRVDAVLGAGLAREFLAHGFDITPEHWAVLNKLWERDGLHQSALAARTGKDRHNMTRILARLERHGHVVRRPDPVDGRRNKVFLTDEGRALESELIPIVLAFLEKALAGFSAEDLARLRELQWRIVRNVENLSS